MNNRGIHPQRNSRLLAIFGEAMDLDPARRAAYLDRACGGDRALQHQAEAMLAADAEPTVTHLQGGNGDDTIRNEALMRVPRAVSAVQDRSWKSSQLLSEGTRIGQHEIIREIGRGGMGAVYLARDTKLGRPVAVKVLQSSQAKMTERFILEAKATARCSHENIVIIHEVGEYGNKPFMVLEYLRGHTLTNEMGNRPIPPGRAVQLIIPVVRALVFAHEMGIVHRDLKPDNIFVTNTGTVKVLDFGIAKVISEKRARKVAELCETMDSIEPRDTDYGVVIGTMPYMAPEQWRGETDNIDHRSDIWAVGIILFKMLTGRHPLAPLRGHQLMVTGVEAQPMPSIRSAGMDVPDELADIIDHCLVKHQRLRMDSAYTLLDALTPLVPGRYRHGTESEESPYPGLAAFHESDADRFFGRSRDIAYILACLRDRPLMGVVGPSGVGKSSFLRAGVIPALKHTGETWEDIIVRPGRQPLIALANALIVATDGHVRSSEHYRSRALANRLSVEPGYAGVLLRERARECRHKILIFVDQFEELYTLVHDSRERITFTTCLSGMADDPNAPLRVVVSIRSDFLDRGSENRRFMADLTPGLVFLPPPDREGLREALTKPAEMFGYGFENPQMVEHMIDTLATTPGALPLLQFAATKLWETRDRQHKLLTQRRYNEIGGVGGALASHADEVLNALPPRAQELVRAIFLRLITPERTRAIASIGELHELTLDTETIQRLIDYLSSARLLVVQSGDDEFGDASIEIVHEVLIRSWPRLTYWLDSHQEDAVFLEQLRVAAKQWQAKGYTRGLLWSGEAEAEARRWHRRYRGPLGKLQSHYLSAVFAAADRVKRKKRLVLIGSFAFLLALVAAAAVALLWIHNAEQRAVEQAQVARTAEREAQHRLEMYEQEQKAREAAEKEKAVAQGERDKANNRAEMTYEQLKRSWESEKKARKKTERLLRAEKRRIARIEEQLGSAVIRRLENLPKKNGR